MLFGHWAAALFIASPLTVAAASGGAHVHGTAAIDIVIEGSELHLDLHSPLDHFVGFERAPRTEREKRALDALRTKLMQPERLFVISTAARCTPEAPSVEMPFGQASNGTKNEAGEHAELHASFTFRCAAPEALRSIEFRLFDFFPGMERVKAQLAGPRGQSAATLTSKRRTLSW